MIKKTMFVVVCLVGTSSLFAQEQKKEITNEFSTEFSTEKPIMVSSQSASKEKTQRSEQFILQPASSTQKVEISEKQAVMKPVSAIVSEVPVRKETTTKQ